jgi:hypothetical protein
MVRAASLRVLDQASGEPVPAPINHPSASDGAGSRLVNAGPLCLDYVVSRQALSRKRRPGVTMSEPSIDEMLG